MVKTLESFEERLTLSHLLSEPVPFVLVIEGSDRRMSFVAFNDYVITYRLFLKALLGIMGGGQILTSEKDMLYSNVEELDTDMRFNWDEKLAIVRKDVSTYMYTTRRAGTPFMDIVKSFERKIVAEWFMPETISQEDFLSLGIFEG